MHANILAVSALLLLYFSRAIVSNNLYLTSWERSFYNFRARPLLIIVIWPKFATCAISPDSEKATFFARPNAHANILALLGALLL